MPRTETRCLESESIDFFLQFYTEARKFNFKMAPSRKHAEFGLLFEGFWRNPTPPAFFFSYSIPMLIKARWLENNVLCNGRVPILIFAEIQKN